MIFRLYPYQNFSDYNLDWIIYKVKELSNNLENFVNINTIKYADPISWNITTQYEANTVVVNPSDGTAYLSVRPVPVGVNITNTDYWTPIFNYAESVDQLREQIAATNEGTSATATVNVTEGQLIWINGTLYRALYDFPQGTAYVEGVNIEAVTIEEIIDELYSYVANVKRGVINVKEYGASGNGVTDDTEAIQNAIDEAEENGYAVHIPSGDYLVSTLWVNSNVYIFGTGRLKGYPVRYDSITNNVSAGSNSLTVADSSFYHKNMILTIKKSGVSEVIVVTDINDNTISFKKFRYYDGLSGHDYLEDSYPSGSEIHINTVPLVITRHIYTVGTDTDENAFPIDNVMLEGISIIGNRSGFDNAKYTIYDITLNGCIFAYRVKGLTINGGTYGTCFNNCIAVLGRTSCTNISNLIISNVNVPSDITDVSLKDVGSGIGFHWDQRKVVSSEIPINFTVTDCVISNCYNGVYTSAARNGNIERNKISGCYHHGIEVYSGDLGFGSFDIQVNSNTVSSVSNSDGVMGDGIELFSVNRASVNNNSIVQCQRGISARITAASLIDSNKVIACTDADIHINRMDGKISNNILASGSGCRATVEINNTTGINISLLEFINNYYEGYNTLNAAINVIKGTNITAICEYCNIRALYKIDGTLSASDNIRAVYCIINPANGVIAITSTERNKISCIGTYANGNKVIITDGVINAKSTTDINAWVDPRAGALLFDTTTQQLKVYNGSSWLVV